MREIAADGPVETGTIALEPQFLGEGFDPRIILAQSARSCDFGQVEERTLNA
ncbi:hypothetical protein [Sphingobium sp.]|uniref:hypothetical protein n=1 Tax=Sphingobium sp. TaxID=1912891 RepID=UPI00257E864F|nr:hypothetical protein [Sphingobium sp.]